MKLKTPNLNLLLSCLCRNPTRPSIQTSGAFVTLCLGQGRGGRAGQYVFGGLLLIKPETADVGELACQHPPPAPCLAWYSLTTLPDSRMTTKNTVGLSQVESNATVDTKDAKGGADISHLERSSFSRPFPSSKPVQG